MRRLVLIQVAIAVLSTVGCVTAPKYRGPSDYLLATDLSVTDVIKFIKAKLGESKYLAARENLDAGLLIFEPRQFSFDKKGVKSLVQQTLQVRHEGGSVKIHITYMCNYSGEAEQPFAKCFQKDKALNDKIKRVEKALIENMRATLTKYKEPTVEIKK